MSTGTLALPGDIIRLAASAAGGATVPTSVNESERTIECCIYSGGPISRYDYRTGANFDLLFKASGVDTTRVDSGSAAVLDSHASYSVQSQFGVVKSVRVLSGKVFATLQLSRRPECEGVWQDLKDGALRGVSMGVVLLEFEDVMDDSGNLKTRTATKWQIYEVSLVSVPADANAVTLRMEEVERMLNGQNPAGGAATAAVPVSLTETQMLEVRTLAANNRLSEFGEQLIQQGVSGQDARVALVNEVARRSEQYQTRSHVTMTRDHDEGRLELMSQGLSSRLLHTKEVAAGAREYASMRVADIARELLSMSGKAAGRQSDARVIELALITTSDFPKLLASTGERMLLLAYQAAEPAIKQIARRSDATDYRAKSVLRLGQTPSLDKVNEAGEVAHGAMAETAESYKVDDYARIIGLTQQALTNDDLGAFGDFTRRFGISAAQREANVLVDLLTVGGVGPTMSDAKTLFHAGHKNLATGASITVDSMADARKLMRLQTDMDGKTVVDVQPRFMVVPANLESVAEQNLAAIAASKPGDVNPFTSKLTLIVEPRLDAKSQIKWYVFGDPDLAPVLEYGYLTGSEGVQVTSRVGFDLLGVEFRAVLTYGAGVVDWRGAVMNPGI